MRLDDLLYIIKDYASTDKATIINAYLFANKAHDGVMRKSGDPYIMHPIAVATILAEMHADVDTIVAGLLHDVIEDCDGINKELIQEKFGEGVANLVDGVTKLPKFSVGNDKYLTEAVNTRKIIESITYDVRILIIKLADRLHNMRTLEFHTREKQIKIAKETLRLFVPFALLIGSYTFKQELEDLSFKYLDKEEYDKIAALEKEAYITNLNVIDKAICEVSQLLNSKNIPFDVKLKIKNYYGLFKELKNCNNDVTKVHDLFAIKFILNDIDTCYYLKDEINNMYPMLKAREKDYIAHPKTNMYKSLHTSVALENGRIVQFQIKTPEMYMINAYGLTAYWDLLKFDHAPEHMQNDLSKLEFFQELRNLIGTDLSVEEFNRVVERDILKEKIDVKTPKGDIIELPVGSTPIDFAFKIHSNLGLNIIGAKVNDVEVPLNYKLKEDDIVEIYSDPNRDLQREDLYLMCESESNRKKLKKYRESFNH